MSGTSANSGSHVDSSPGHAHGSWKKMGTGELATQDADWGLGHTMPLQTLNRVFIALLVLTVVTVAAAQVNFGAMNSVVAILIATVKAALVGTFFMHLKFESKTILMYIAYPVILLILLVGSQVSDVVIRAPEEPVPSTKAFQPDAPHRTFVAPHGDHGDAAGHTEPGHSEAAH